MNKKDVFRKFSLCLNSGKIPLPRIIHIETRSKCNSNCNFCPASVENDKRKDIHMGDSLIDKILSDLSEVDYCGRVSFYNNNEPFLDERLFSLIAKARNRLPKAYLEIKTNGITINLEKIISIFNSGLDMLYINYNATDYLLSSRIKEIKKALFSLRRLKGHLEGNCYCSRIKCYKRYSNYVSGTRAGTSPNKGIKGNSLRRICLRPFEMMTISPEGNVSVCSEDFGYNILMGSIVKSKIIEIWNSKKWNEFRKHLLEGERNYNSTCSLCDYRGYSYEILKENGVFSTLLVGELKEMIKKLLNWHKKDDWLS